MGHIKYPTPHDLVQELGEFIINPLTAQYCSASDLRTAVAAREALATSDTYHTLCSVRLFSDVLNDASAGHKLHNNAVCICMQ